MKEEHDTRTAYTYDNMYRVASAAVTTDTRLDLSVGYTYTDDLLTKIATPTTTYNFNYGAFGLRSNIKVGTQTLASYDYTDDGNFYLEKLAYGNEDSVQYTYDDQGRVTAQTYEDGDTVTYQYDNSGALATVTDSATALAKSMTLSLRSIICRAVITMQTSADSSMRMRWYLRVRAC